MLWGHKVRNSCIKPHMIPPRVAPCKGRTSQPLHTAMDRNSLLHCIACCWCVHSIGLPCFPNTACYSLNCSWCVGTLSSNISHHGFFNISTIVNFRAIAIIQQKLYEKLKNGEVFQFGIVAVNLGDSLKFESNVLTVLASDKSLNLRGLSRVCSNGRMMSMTMLGPYYTQQLIALTRN